MLVDRTVHRHRLFEQSFKPTTITQTNSGKQAPAQVKIEDFKGIFQDRLQALARDALLGLMEQEVTDLCGESHRPTAGTYRRGGSEMVTIRTTSGKEGRKTPPARKNSLPGGRGIA